MSESGDPAGFGIDAFALDDRLRLFHFTAADKRADYLRVLRAFDRARANYQVLLHANDVAEHLAPQAGGILARGGDEHAAGPSWRSASFRCFSRA